MKLLTLLLLGTQIVLAAKSLAGFNYGAFWGDPKNAKTKQDFLDGFNMAKNLSTDISFNNARLFSCIQAGTENDATGAFEAAIETKTNLLLGFWITPANRAEPHDKLIDDEFSALEKGFQKHGQALADLVLGLSVGNEDIYRFVDTAESGVAADNVAQTIDKVKKRIAASSFAKYMKDKPVGHIDTAQHAIVDNADFIGMNAYPYWTNEHIDKAKVSFLATLEAVKQKAGNRPVWVTEVGWPVKGPQRGDAVASAENLQQHWTEVGCALFENYPTFWFELVTDATADQPDWGLMDIPSRQPRIKELKCPTAFPSASPSPSAGSSQTPVPPPASSPLPQATTLSTLPSPSASPAPSAPSSIQPVAGSSTAAGAVTVTVTVYTTVYATTQPAAMTPRSSLSDIPADRPWCVTVADIDRNGQFIPVNAGPASPDGKCKSPPAWNWPTGSPSAALNVPPASPPPAAPASQVVAISSAPAPPPPAAPAQSSSSVHPYCKAKSQSRAASLAASASLTQSASPTLPPSAQSSKSDYDKRGKIQDWFKKVGSFSKKIF